LERSVTEEQNHEEMDCGETLHRLYHYLDGELTDDRREAIAEHLDECEPCLEAFGFEAELRRVIADRCRDEVPPHLLERIAGAIRHERSVSVGGGAGSTRPT
jgi:mycothiol system anti-sigma-R factor